MNTVNSRADLDALRGTAAFEVVLRGLYGSTVTWTLSDGAWLQGEDYAAVERFDFTKAQFLAEIAPFDFPAPVAPPTPAPVIEKLPDLEPWRFFAVLQLAGYADNLDAFIAAMPEPDKTVARNKLDRTLIFIRDNDLVLAAQAGMGITSEQLDALWLQALSL